MCWSFILNKYPPHSRRTHAEAGSGEGESASPLEVTKDTGGPADHEREGQEEEREAEHEQVVDNVHDHLTVDNDEEDETVENAERTTSRRSVNLPFNINTVGNSTVYRKTFHTLAHESILYES